MMLNTELLYHAQSLLAPVLDRTPMVSTKGLVDHCSFYLKAECLQKTGAFKLRGAYYKIACLSEEEKARGVIACSAGNHAQGVAYAARDMGIRATICIPEGAPISKIEATRSYGAEVVLVPGVYDDAYAEAVRLQNRCVNDGRQTGAVVFSLDDHGAIQHDHARPPRVVHRRTMSVSSITSASRAVFFRLRSTSLTIA